jgi:hypothetical protein
MPDFDPLNASELDELEKRLSGMSLSPTQRERERLLYACGQAAGRAQLMRRVRGATAIAAVLGCVCAGLACALVLREQPTVAAVDRAPSHSSDDLGAASQIGGLSNGESLEVMGSQTAELRVSTNMAELALSDRGATSSSSPGTATFAPESVLTVSGPLSDAL